MKKSLISIRILTLGFSKIFKIENNSKISDALKISGLSISKDYSYYVNGLIVTIDKILKDGDILIVTFPVKASAIIKRSGKIWEYHKNDSDKFFPSDFHLHSIESPEVLDMYTGYIYNSKTRKPIGALSSKDMKSIYAKLKENKDPDISIRCTDDTNIFPYLN
jgi:hypothetical protein